MAKGERKRALRGRAGRMQGGRGSGRASSGQVRLWGRHAVEAALKNPNRVHRKLWATREAIESLDGELPEDFPLEYADEVIKWGVLACFGWGVLGFHDHGPALHGT